MYDDEKHSITFSSNGEWEWLKKTTYRQSNSREEVYIIGTWYISDENELVLNEKFRYRESHSEKYGFQKDESDRNGKNTYDYGVKAERDDDYWFLDSKNGRLLLWGTEWEGSSSFGRWIGRYWLFIAMVFVELILALMLKHELHPKTVKAMETHNMP